MTTDYATHPAFAVRKNFEPFKCTGTIDPTLSCLLSPDMHVKSVVLKSQTPHTLKFVYHEETGKLEIVVEEKPQEDGK
jgi:hypothetical protein